MKCLFINPRVADFTEGLSPDQIPPMKKVVAGSRTLQERLEFSRRAFSGLGLLTAASVGAARDRDFRFDFLDENMEPVPFAEKLREGYDLVALGGTVYQMNRMLSLVAEAQRQNVPVVVGGAAVMTFPRIFQRKGVGVVAGESEALFPEFLDDLRKGAPSNVYMASSSVGASLKDSPPPRYSKIARYPYTFIGVQTTRGCPWRCEFCQVSGMLGSKYRHKPVERVIEEIEEVKALWPDAFFFFYDNNLFADRAFARELFEKMAEAGIRLGRWGTNSDVSIYKDPALLDLALERGPLDFLGVGFESLSKASLETIGNSRKAELLEEYEEAVRVFRQKGIGVFGYFMFGFENSRKEDLDAAADFIVAHEINGQISQLLPMPGTRLYHRLLEEYESRYGPLRKGPLGQWSAIRSYLLGKSGFSRKETTELLAGAYARIYDDALHKGEALLPAPFL